MEPNGTTPRYELKDELARLCLPPASRDASLKLAWVNSICLLFLLIGLAGARRGMIYIKPVPPIRTEVPVVVLPTVVPPQAVAQKSEPVEPTAQPQVRVVLPSTPNINFSVPTVGTLVAPAALFSPPPVQVAPVHTVSPLNSTGAGGERPEPPYPKIALEAGQQGTVVLSLTGDDTGNVVTVEVKTSSGFPILDRATVDYVKRHWRLPTEGNARLFETSISYKLLLN